MAIDKDKMKDNLKKAGSATGSGLKKASKSAATATGERAKIMTFKEVLGAIGIFAIVGGGVVCLIAGNVVRNAEPSIPTEDPYSYEEPFEQPTDQPMDDVWADEEEEPDFTDEEPVEEPTVQTHGRYIGIAIKATDPDDDLSNAEFEYTITRTDTGEEMMTEKGLPHEVGGDWQYYFDDLTDETQLEISGTLDGLAFSTTVSENPGDEKEVDQHFFNVELFNGEAYIEETT